MIDNDAKALAGRILRVNHAGEHGAVNIYAGQIAMARLTAPKLIPELRQFKSDEERHRLAFQRELISRRTPRCPSYWLCGAGGFFLGVVTGLFGRRAIAATTVAVETVVLSHLASQIELLQDRDEAAVTVIRSIVDEERAHHDASHSLLMGDRFWGKVLTPIVAAATETVIWIGMHS